MTIFRVVACCLIFLPAAVAFAGDGTLYKCVDAKGAVSILSEQCPTGSTQVWKRGAAPDPALTPEQAAAAEARRLKDAADARALSEMAGTTRKVQPAAVPAPVVAPVASAPAADGPPKSDCRKAHELSDAMRALDWLALREEQLQRLGDWVVRQCADPGDGD